MIIRLLDLLLAVTMVAAPPVLLAAALGAFRDILRRDWRLLLLIMLAIWVVLLQLFSPLTETFNQQMIHTQTVPWFSQYRESLAREGRAPLWLPTFGVGTPAMASPYTGYFSPLTPLVLLFRVPEHALNVLVMAHLVVLGASTYLFIRSVGRSRLAAVLAVLPAVFTPWVFRRLSPEVHAMYVLGYAWLPLAWALALRFARTHRPLDALRVGIPLAFMGVTLPTVFALAVVPIGLIVVSTLRPSGLWRGHARGFLRQVGLLLLVPLATFLAAAPEHLSMVELASLNRGNRFVEARIFGWRDRDLSTKEFFRTLFPHELGQALAPLSRTFAPFGVPFSPGDAFMAVAIVGAGAAFARRSLRQQTRPLLHLLLFLFFANVATHGIFYEPLHRAYRLWAMSGNWPVLGALLLMILVLWFAVGVETIVSLLRRIGAGVGRRWEVSRPFMGRRIGGALVVAFLVLLAVELLFGVKGTVRAARGLDPDGRAEMRYGVGRMRISDLDRMPHLATLKGLVQETATLPVRVYCTADRAGWPSPCFDNVVGRYGLESVGPGDQHWVLPWWQWGVMHDLWKNWNGSFSTLFSNLLKLSVVQYLVSTRDVGFPPVATVPWDPAPGDFEHWGNLHRHIGGGPWKEGWDQQIRLQTFPGFAQGAFVADPVVVSGLAENAQQAVTDLLSRDDVHPLALVFLHGDTVPDALRRETSLPVLEADAAGAGERLMQLGSLPAFRAPPGRVKLNVQRPGAGRWTADGLLKRPGALLFSTLYYPGLRATVNGRVAPVHRADLFFAAVLVPKGDIHVELTYAPIGILLSSLLTAGAATGLAVAAWREARGGPPAAA